MSEEFYNEEILTASFKELETFLTFLKGLGKPHPIIIGGWAVYSYKHGLGSRDIDVIMISDADIEQNLLKNYFPVHNIEPRKSFGALIPSYYSKIIKTTNDELDIHFDIFSGDHKREDEEDLGIRFDWNWILQNNIKKEIKGLEIYVPKIELLIITKIIASLGRSKTFDQTGSARLPAKIWKDYRDIAVLTKMANLDSKFYEEYLVKSNVLPLFEKFLAKYKLDEYSDILNDYDITYDEIESKLKPKT